MKKILYIVLFLVLNSLLFGIVSGEEEKGISICKDNIYFVDGKDIREMDNTSIRATYYSSIGNSFSFLLWQNGKGSLVKDGFRIGQKYNYDDIIDFKYGDNGNFYYIGFKDGIIYMNENDESSTELFSPENGEDFFWDGNNKLGYIVIEDDPEGIYNQSHYIIIDDKKEKEYGKIIDFHYGEQGYYYIGLKDNKYIIVKNGKEILYSEESIYDLVFSEDMSNFTYITRKNQKTHVVFNGIGGKEYNKINSLIISPDGTSISYIVTKEDGKVVVKDGVESKKYFDISNLLYAPFGNNISFKATLFDEAKQVIIHHGKELEKYSNSYITQVGNFGYSADGEYFSYFVEEINGKDFIVTNSIKGNEYDKIKFFKNINGEESNIYIKNTNSLAFITGDENKNISGTNCGEYHRTVDKINIPTQDNIFKKSQKELRKQKVISKHNLSKNIQTQKFIIAIDRLVSNTSDKKLESVGKKLETFSYVGKSEQITNIFKYLEAKISEEISKRKIKKN